MSGKLSKVIVAKTREDLAAVLGDNSTLQDFMVFGQTNSAVGCIFYRLQRVEAHDQ